ncbi:MAG: c-type cytochrome [Isosphaeraceae bacterium]
MVLKVYPDLEPELKPRAVELLTQRASWGISLVSAVESNAIPVSALNVNQIRRLQGIRDEALSVRVKALWGTVREGRDRAREEVVARYRRHVEQTPGDPFQGKKVYERVCGQCHKIYGEGQEVGPDLTSNGRNDLEQLVSNVFDPSLVIGAGYQATTIATADGRVLTGLLVEDTNLRVVLKQQGGKVETIHRKDIEEQRISEVSLMPEDLDKQLQPQEIADLFAFLGLDRPPTDPSARRLPGLPEPRSRPGAGGR